MSITLSRPRVESPNTELHAGSLGTGSIVFMVVAAAAPLTVIAGALPLGIALGNGPGYPAMYAVSAILLGLFSVGLTTMSKHLAEPGAFYSYVEAAFGRKAGIGTAYLALLTYTTIQLSVYGYLGASLAALCAPIIALPWWIYTLAMVAVVGFLGYRRIELSSKALGVLLISEIAIVVLIDVFVVGRGAAAQSLNLESFTPDAIGSGAPGIGLMLALAGFIGFEATTVFRAEAKDPDRVIPRATYISVAIIGIFYTVSAWAIVQAWGTDAVVAAASEDPEGLVMATAVHYLGPWAGHVVQVLLITSLFAAVLSFHNVLARYQHAISHKRGLPRQLRRVHDTYESPHLSSLVQSLTASVLVLACALVGLDPVLQVFTWFSGVATFSIVVLMLLTSVAIIAFFRGRQDLNLNLWQSTIAPQLSAVGLAVALYLVASNLSVLVDSTLIAGIILAGVPALFVAGWCFGTVIPEHDRAEQHA